MELIPLAGVQCVSLAILNAICHSALALGVLTVAMALSVAKLELR
jgi:hypothetical protein